MIQLRRLALIVLLLLFSTGGAGCSYYIQALSGQMEILSKRQPIAELLESPDTRPGLKEKLTLVLQLRDFASSQLLLPDNKSYRSYAELERPFVVWNVFATPEFSLEPKTWCFLIIGCVGYRGYFDHDDALAFAAKLRAQGFDVYLGGVAAFSTLGWFHDPMLNTVLRRSRAEVAGIMFHELAHQRLYVQNDTGFNESFATTVELEGVRRWMREHGSTEEYERYRLSNNRRAEFADLILVYRDRLRRLYASESSTAEKRAAKAKTFAELKRDYGKLKTSWGGHDGYDDWFAQDLNNAHLTSVGTYHQHVVAFRSLLKQHRGDLDGFYRAAEELGRLPPEERVAALTALRNRGALETD
jgi:predicted aminopeptidase